MIETEKQKEALRHEYGIVFEKLDAYRRSLLEGLVTCAEQKISKEYEIESESVKAVLEHISDSFRILLHENPEILDNFLQQMAIAVELNLEMDDRVNLDTDIVVVHTGKIGEESAQAHFKNLEDGLNDTQKKAVLSMASLFTLRSDVILGHIQEPGELDISEDYFLKIVLTSMMETFSDLELELPDQWKFLFRGAGITTDLFPSRIRELRDSILSGRNTFSLGSGMEVDTGSVIRDLEEYSPLLTTGPADFEASDAEFEKRLAGRREKLLKFLEQITQVYEHPIDFIQDILGFKTPEELSSIIVSLEV